MKAQKYQVKVTFSCNRKTSVEKMTIKEGVENSRFMSLTVNKLSSKSRSSLVIIGSDYDTEFDIDDVELFADNIKDLKTPDTYTKEEYQALQEQNKLLEKENRELKKNLDTILTTMKTAISKLESAKNPPVNVESRTQNTLAQSPKPRLTPKKEITSESHTSKEDGVVEKLVETSRSKTKKIS